MLTIERLAKIDNIVTRVIEWVCYHYEALLVDAAYRVAEAKAAARTAAAKALVAADEDYEATIREASEKLGLEIEA